MLKLLRGLLVFSILVSACKKKEGTEPEDPTPSTPVQTSSVPQYIWPIEHELNDRNIIINYYDSNKGTGFRDQNCGTLHGYDGHLGVDIAIYSFRAMDEGIAVVASAPGVVTALEVSKNDRVYWTPYLDTGNFVSISYPDGSYTVYYHLRKNSVTVEIGESVERGQIIGYVGSSGATPFPHLHLETKIAKITGGFESIDPYEGNCNSETSLWQTEPIYVANQPLQILDAGTFTDFQYNGEYQFGEIKTLKDRPTSPAVYGKDQDKLGFWVQMQGNIGDQYEIKITKPDGSIFIQETKTLQQKRRYGWQAMNWSLDQVTSSDFGTWKAQVIANGIIEKEIDIELGQSTEFGPRFYPLAGQSVKIGSGINTLELQVEGDENYDLFIEDASSGVSLNGDQLVIPGSSGQTHRNHWVNVIATDSKGRKDTYRLHLIDTSKPFRD